jgi:hypothetical protein
MINRPYGIRRVINWTSWEYHTNPKLFPSGRFTQNQANKELAKLPQDDKLKGIWNWHIYLIS